MPYFAVAAVCSGEQNGLRTGSALLLPRLIQETGVMCAEVLAWLGADLILVPSYFLYHAQTPALGAGKQRRITMTEKVQILRRDGLPVPLIALASPEDLARWYADGLLWSLEHGERVLSIACFDTKPAFGFDMSTASQAVLKAVTDVLYDHPEAERLTILCADDASFRAYRFHWNLWYAEFKPKHEH